MKTTMVVFSLLCAFANSNWAMEMSDQGSSDSNEPVQDESTNGKGRVDEDEIGSSDSGDEGYFSFSDVEDEECSVESDEAIVPHPLPEEAQPVHRAAYEGNIIGIENCFEDGVEINTPDAFGRNPVHYAAMGGHMPTLQWLIACKANPNALDDRGFQPMHYAVENDHGAIVSFLEPPGQLQQRGRFQLLVERFHSFLDTRFVLVVGIVISGCLIGMFTKLTSEIDQ